MGKKQPQAEESAPVDVDSAAVRLHATNHGKIATALKVPLETKADLSLAYTPGVAAVCKEIAADPAKAKELTIKRNTIGIITDGSAVLGLGNIGGLAALPVMEGKAALFKRFADVDAFPICLNTQDTEEIIKTILAIAPVFGGINLEDIAAPRCFEIEARLKAMLDIPVMHDDQHGTAVVVLAALINAFKVRELERNQARIVISGAGAAGTAVADLLITYGCSDITLVDSQGIITSERAELTDEKKRLAGSTNPRKTQGGLAEALVGADVFIGVSKAGLLTQDMIKSMRPGPVVFALANPVPEIMPDLALEAGALVVATGRSDFPNQINNVLAFPGIFRGALDNGVTKITDLMFLNAAQNLASLVENPTAGEILPSLFDADVVLAVATAIKA